jgi:Flp pilus assembly protein TadD
MSVSFRLRIDPAGPEAASGPGPMHDAVEALSGGKELDKATLAAFRKAVHLEPTEPDYHYILGEALVRVGRQDEGLAFLREAIRLQASDADYRYALGEALWELDRLEEALAQFREAVRLRPREARFLNALGAALSRSGGENEAVAVLEAAIRLGRRRAPLLGNLGAALWQAGRHEEALRAFRAAVRVEPASPDAARNLAVALAAAGHGTEAAKCLQRLVRARPHDASARADLADALYATGRRAEAARAYDDALRLDPGCLRERPESREARDAMALERVRDEVRSEADAGSRLAGPLWAGALGAMRALGAVPRRLAVAGGTGLVAAVAYAAWVMLPPYLTHYLLRDRIVQIARAPLTDDRDVHDRLAHAAREYGLEDQLPEGACEVSTRPNWRTIACRYQVRVRLLPGLERTLHFRIRVEEPYLADRGVRFF